MSPITDAYAAGLLDGEGCISILKSKTSYSITVDVGMTAKAFPLLERLKGTYGGTVRSTRAATDKWEAARAWGVRGDEAASFLKRVQPHVQMKTEQIRIALLLEECRTTRAAGWTDEGRKRCEILRLRMQELNRKGPAAPEPKKGWFARLVAGEWIQPQGDLFSDLGWAPFSGPWPRSGMTCNGTAFPLPPSAPLTDVTDGSLWPTPRAGDGMNDQMDTVRARLKAGSAYSSRLEEAVALETTASGRLSPTWVEWLMGFPSGWTDLEL